MKSYTVTLPNSGPISAKGLRGLRFLASCAALSLRIDARVSTRTVSTLELFGASVETRVYAFCIDGCTRSLWPDETSAYIALLKNLCGDIVAA